MSSEQQRVKEGWLGSHKHPPLRANKQHPDVKKGIFCPLAPKGQKYFRAGKWAKKCRAPFLGGGE